MTERDEYMPSLDEAAALARRLRNESGVGSQAINDRIALMDQAALMLEHLPHMIEAVRHEEREKAARIADSEGHHWSGAPAHAFFEAAERIREQGKEQDRG